MAEVGALLEAKAVDKGRSARNHLLALGATNGMGAARVDEVLELVGLADVARKRAGGFSLGMGQRLGIASALLGDPQIVMLDEPVNGLDPDGILWIRTLLKELAAEGRTVFLSLAPHERDGADRRAPHRDRARADPRRHGDGRVHRRRPRPRACGSSRPTPSTLRDLLAAPASRWPRASPACSTSRASRPGVSARSPPSTASPCTSSRRVAASLEEAFMELTRDSVEYHGASTVHRDRKAA